MLKSQLKKKKPTLVNQQNVVYKFQCGMCDACYVGFTQHHLQQRIEEHKRPSSSIGKHIISHSGNKKEILNTDHFKILKHCHSKFDCLLYEMLFIRNLKPPLNVQSDSIKAKLFI